MADSIPFILASASERRKEILKITGLDFKTLSPEMEEHYEITDDPVKTAERLALEKSQTIAKTINDPALLISADTLITLDQKILTKPRNHYKAVAMLTSLSGKTHEVITAICINQLPQQTVLTGFLKTEVVFKHIDETLIWDYVNLYSPLDFAGAYAIQGPASLFIEKINGDYLNVVGLPLSLLFDMLQKIGYNLLTNQWLESDDE